MSKREQSVKTEDITGQHDKKWSKTNRDFDRHHREAEI